LLSEDGIDLFQRSKNELYQGKIEFQKFYNFVAIEYLKKFQEESVSEETLLFLKGLNTNIGMDIGFNEAYETTLREVINYFLQEHQKDPSYLEKLPKEALVCILYVLLTETGEKVFFYFQQNHIFVFQDFYHSQEFTAPKDVVKESVQKHFQTFEKNPKKVKPIC